MISTISTIDTMIINTKTIHMRLRSTIHITLIKVITKAHIMSKTSTIIRARNVNSWQTITILTSITLTLWRTYTMRTEMVKSRFTVRFIKMISSPTITPGWWSLPLTFRHFIRKKEAKLSHLLKKSVPYEMTISCSFIIGGISKIKSFSWSVKHPFMKHYKNQKYRINPRKNSLMNQWQHGGTTARRSSLRKRSLT